VRQIYFDEMVDCEMIIDEMVDCETDYFDEMVDCEMRDLIIDHTLSYLILSYLIISYLVVFQVSVEYETMPGWEEDISTVLSL